MRRERFYLPILTAGVLSEEGLEMIATDGGKGLLGAPSLYPTIPPAALLGS